MQVYQRTLKRPVSCTGVGLHSGKKVNLTLRPADANTGILFKRGDLPGSPFIPGDVYHVVDTRLNTTVGKGGAMVATVEHLMSALAGLGVDNAVVEVDAPEIPVMDGSSAPFVFLIKSAGFTSQAAPRQYYRVQRPVSIEQDGKSLSVEPAEILKVDYVIDFGHPRIGRQEMTFNLSSKDYDHEISRARTFGFLQDYNRLRQAGLALGGSLDNAVVLDEYRVLNDDGLRFDDEFVRHKVLDLVGDLALVGRPVVGRFRAVKSGHHLNNLLFKKLLDDPSAWQLVTPDPEELTHMVPQAMAEPAPLAATA